ncbi:aminoglycoside phosphotransferase family protein [Terrabacter terrae]|uniref:Aminoglycoside phosphotransferase family protein n=1 Tax=Terrabacter terrae TaxID=318434 RepID=A0ABN2TWE2_9MICO
MSPRPADAPDVIDAALLDEALVGRLLAEQFTQWADLPVRRVVDGGNDHRMFRLGETLSVRLPSAAGYVPQVEKEQTWLPRLAMQLPLPIPQVRGAGRASSAFPAPWSVYGWIAGTPASPKDVRNEQRFASDLAGFLVALRSADPSDAPGPGPHSAFRGGPPEHWDEEMHDLVHRVSGRERELARAIWSDALDARFDGTPAWVHGDVAIANLLVGRDGRLSAVIDFGCSAVGDPACDTVIRWTQLRGRARRTFVQELGVDDATWARGRGWALWKGLIMLTNEPPGQAQFARHVLDEVFAGG